MIKAVSMLILMEQDLDAAIAFYQELGGLRLIFRMKEKWAEFDLHGIKIGLCPTSQPRMECRTGIVLEVSDIKGLYERLKDAHCFMQEPTEKVHGIIASIKDPGGNIIDLYEPTPHKLQEFIEQVKEQESVDQGCCGSKKTGCSKAPKNDDSCASGA